MVTRVFDYEMAMEELKDVNEKAYNWLSRTPLV